MQLFVRTGRTQPNLTRCQCRRQSLVKVLLVQNKTLAPLSDEMLWDVQLRTSAIIPPDLFSAEFINGWWGCRQNRLRSNWLFRNWRSDLHRSTSPLNRFGTLLIQILYCSSSFRLKKSFYRAAITIFGKTGRTASEEVSLHLITTKCVPCLLYSLEACPLTQSDIKSLDFVINRFFMKMFQTSDINVV